MLSEEQFFRLSNLLKDETAVVLGNGKEYLVESRLSCVVREEGFSSLSDLIDTVLSGVNSSLCKRVLLALTTNETSFFRDQAPFELLKSTILPKLVSERRSTTRTLNIWSAACSTGQEPYSIAMILRSLFYQSAKDSLGSELAGSDFKCRILASDLHTGAVERTRQGEYSILEVGRGLPEGYLERFFVQKGERFVIVPELRGMLDVFEQNLISQWNVPQVDIIFMRNVLIYFDTQTKIEILNRVKRTLTPDGYLFLGTAESPFRIVEGFVKVAGAANVYRLA
jgi:chemotaxis protein methyltransferase CheR